MLFYKQQIQTKQLSKQKKIKNKTKKLSFSNLLVVHTFYVRPSTVETRLNADSKVLPDFPCSLRRYLVDIMGHILFNII